MKIPPYTVRDEHRGDAAPIREVHRLAFDGDVEADIVDRLRESCPEQLSLVAARGDRVIGHILFTPVLARAGERSIKGMGLAPMGVHPRYQRCGVGTALVRRGVEVIREIGYPYIVVLGHPSYYPRFGFERASAYGLESEYDGVPEEAFMIAVLDADVVDRLSGVVRYRPEFAEAT